MRRGEYGQTAEEASALLGWTPALHNKENMIGGLISSHSWPTSRDNPRGIANGACDEVLSEGCGEGREGCASEVPRVPSQGCDEVLSEFASEGREGCDEVQGRESDGSQKAAEEVLEGQEGDEGRGVLEGHEGEEGRGSD